MGVESHPGTATVESPFDSDSDSGMISSSTSLNLQSRESNEKASLWQSRWQRNKGVIFVLLSEMFGACMIATARLLQNGTSTRPGMNTLQILFVRFAITMIFSTLYMWYTSVPDFPWGPKGVRLLLVVRGILGFIAVFGFYYSVKYLPLSEAIIIGFLTPLLTAWACSVVLHTPFTKRQLLAGLISLFGVVLIAQPTTIFNLKESKTPDHASNPSTRTDPDRPTPTTTLQRLSSILLGVTASVMAACVLTIIRLIGDRAHPLISVNYYAILATFLSFFAILLIPSLSFQIPHDATEWGYLLSLGVYGFLLQFLMTKGLQLDKTSRATNMMYSQIVFAIILDWSIWGVLPGVWSWVGGAIVVGSTVWAAFQKVEEDNEKAVVVDAEYGLVPLQDFEHEEEEEEEQEQEEEQELDSEVTFQVDPEPSSELEEGEGARKVPTDILETLVPQHNGILRERSPRGHRDHERDASA